MRLEAILTSLNFNFKVYWLCRQREQLVLNFCNHVGGSRRSAHGASAYLSADASVPEMRAENGASVDEFDLRADVRHLQRTAKSRVLHEVSYRVPVGESDLAKQCSYGQGGRQRRGRGDWGTSPSFVPRQPHLSFPMFIAVFNTYVFNEI